MRIYKYDISKSSVAMPKGAKILSLHVQFNKATIWALVNPDNDLVKRKLLHIPTGCGESQNFSDLEYIGTYLVDGGNGVYHVFEDMS